MLNITYTPDDITDALRLHAAQTIKRRAWVFILFYALTLALATLLYIQGHAEQTQSLLLALAGATTLFFPALFLIVHPRIARRLYQQYKALQRPSQISWDHEYLYSVAEDGQTKRRWTELIRANENRKVFLLYVSENHYTIYPKRCFDSEATLNDFRTHIPQTLFSKIK